MLSCMSNELNSISQTQSAAHIAAVLAYRVLADTEHLGDVFTTEACCHRFEHIKFARGEIRRDVLTYSLMHSIETLSNARLSSVEYTWYVSLPLMSPRFFGVLSTLFMRTFYAVNRSGS